MLHVLFNITFTQKIKYECLFPSLCKHAHPQNTKESNYLNDYTIHSFV